MIYVGIDCERDCKGAHDPHKLFGAVVLNDDLALSIIVSLRSTGDRDPYSHMTLA